MARTKLWINPTSTADHLGDTEEKRRQVYLTIDRNNFDWQVFLVSASGFFTDSYNLFATNVILPSLAYVYWPTQYGSNNETAINAVTLGGSAIGQLLFGYLADRYGRRKLYGLELIIVIVSTLGLAQASTGYSLSTDTGCGSMCIMGWLLFYRLLQGIGIGAEYPLSALITTEFASTGSRARMMAAVFLMQPLGQLLAAIVGLAVVLGYRNQRGTDDLDQKTVDRIWRWVIGVGAFPAFLAILFRLTIPESPRYTLDVDEDAQRALQDALVHYGSRESVVSQEMAEAAIQAHEGRRAEAADFTLDANLSPAGTPGGSIIEPVQPASGPSERRFWSGFHKYLFVDGNWLWLAGTSSCWFLLDFAYYGLEINNPHALAEIWASTIQPYGADRPYFSWDSGLVNGTGTLDQDDSNIFYVLRNDAIRSIITTCIGSLIGSVLLIKLIPYIPRRAWLYWSFALLFLLLLGNGVSFFFVVETANHAITIVLYSIIQLVFNLGPNSLIFIISAEIFPTRYRGTCYGISAAAGKLSSVVVTIFLPYTIFRSTNKADPNDTNWYPVTEANSTGLGYILIIFSFLMLLGGVCARFLIPEVQDSRAGDNTYELPSKTLEVLAKGRQRTNPDEESGTRRRWFTKCA